MDITMNVTDHGGAESARSPNPSPGAGESGVLPPKRIFRDPSGPIGGVAGGFAGYFDIDPVITRLLWIVALFSGIGFPAYLVCWLVIPKAKAWPPPGYDRAFTSAHGQNHTALLSGFVIIGLVAVIGTGVDGVGEYLLPAALIGFGVYLLGQRGSASAQLASSAAPAPSDPTGAAPAAPAAPLESWREPPKRERSGLVTPTVLSVLAIAVGVVGTLHAAGIVHVSMATVSAASLVIVGVGLIVSLWFGRARGLVPLGLGLVVVMLAAATIGPWLDDPRSPRERAVSALMGGHPGASPSSGSTMSSVAAVGDRKFTPATLAELEPYYEIGMGNLTLDLSRLDFSGEIRDLGIDVGMGSVTVIVPADTAVRLEGEVGAGEATVFGHRYGGLGFDVDTTDDGTEAGRLDIDIEVGMGKAEVRRVGL